MHPAVTFIRHHPQSIAAVTSGALALAALSAYLVMRKKISPEEREVLRRTRLAEHGRIIDGTLIDTAPHISGYDSGAEPPHALIYRYRVGGVTYECGQDISMLMAQLPDLGLSASVFGMPVQVRYDRENPADSIILAETWNGLWNQVVAAPSPRQGQGGIH
jgi:hypothetical protein